MRAPAWTEGASPREHLRIAPRGRDDEQVDHRRERRGVAPERRPAEPVVHEPPGGEARHRDGNRLPRLERHHARIDEPRARVEVELDDKQGESGHPGEVRLPLEPGEVLGQRGRGNGVLLHVVEAAPVHLPCFAGHPGGGAVAAPQREVEGDEVERRPDPGDTGDQVRPPDEQVEPVEGECGHGRGSEAGEENALARRRQRLSSIDGESMRTVGLRHLDATEARKSAILATPRAERRLRQDTAGVLGPGLRPARWRSPPRTTGESVRGGGAPTAEARRRRPSRTSSCRGGCRRRAPRPRRSPSSRPACGWGR